MKHSLTRRSFLKKTAAVGAAAFMAPAILRADGSPNGKVRLAFIGVGGIGRAHISNFADEGIQVPCYCDVDTTHMGDAAQRWPDAKPFQDYRKMFDRMHKQIDAVAIGIPDHHHYPATLLAMRLGKHCYTQKPLTHTVWEARALAEEHAKNPRIVTQMGNQGHAGEGWRILYEWIHSGAIGDVTEVHSWSNRPIWPQGLVRPAGEDPVPPNLDWDVWLGPAPARPYKKDVYHAFKWRAWWDFGGGALADMACHMQDGMYWSLDPGHPTSIEPIQVSSPTDEAFPKQAIIKYQFPARDKRPAFTSFWYDGGLMPEKPKELEADRKLPKTGNIFYGTKATILVQGDYGGTVRIIPETRMKEIGKPPELLERSPGHYKEFIMACREEKPRDFAKSNFSYAGPMTESILLGNLALKVGSKIEWDGPGMKVTNNPDANKYVNKEYRRGWKF